MQNTGLSTPLEERFNKVSAEPGICVRLCLSAKGRNYQENHIDRPHSILNKLLIEYLLLFILYLLLKPMQIGIDLRNEVIRQVQ